MDKSKFVMSDDVKEIKFMYKGEEVSIKVKPLSWSKKNQILSNCFAYGTDGSATFNFDRYMKDTLSEMIVEAPWGPTNHIFLNSLDPELGDILQKVAPKAFDSGGQVPDFFVKG